MHAAFALAIARVKLTMEEPAFFFNFQFAMANFQFAMH
jgi:hypothetical protein